MQRQSATTLQCCHQVIGLGNQCLFWYDHSWFNEGGGVCDRPVYDYSYKITCMHLGLQDTLVRPYFQRDLFSEQSSNYSQNKYTINGHSQLDPICSSSISPPGKWSHRTKEWLTFLSNTPSLLKGHDSTKGSGHLTVGRPWKAAVIRGRGWCILMSPQLYASAQTDHHYVPKAELQSVQESEEQNLLE